MLDRRRFLGRSALGAAMLSMPRIAFARTTGERRFVFIIQRGAADGLHVVIPYGDRHYSVLRGRLAVEDGTRLDAQFALHPSLVETAKLYAEGQALFVHAVASGYRARSHFDAQNMLETGGDAPYRVKSGWLNRLLALLPDTGRSGLAVAPTVPLALRGEVTVTSYAPSALPDPDQDLMMRVEDLYSGDPQLAALWSAAIASRPESGANGNGQAPATLGALAAQFLARADGPRIAMIESNGWDTHSQQAPRLARQLNGLDQMIAALRTGLAEQWASTTVLVATEFGRTAAINGTGGTDHGTASAAMLIGGAVAGGRVLADWPGLATADLHEGRDLRPTASLEALITAAAAECFALDPEQVRRSLFEGMRGRTGFSGLIRAS